LQTLYIESLAIYEIIQFETIMNMRFTGWQRQAKQRRRDGFGNARPLRRRLLLECLEVREMLAADLSITETGSPNPVSVGQQETYHLVVTNNDAVNTANKVLVHDTLPANASFVTGSTTPPGGTVTQSFNTITAALGDLAPGATVTVDLIATFSQAGIENNRATVTSDTPDDNQNNNTADMSTTIGATGGGADLSITESGSSGSINVGQQQTYTLTITNNDPANLASGVVATDTLAPGANVVAMAISARDGNVTLSGNTVTADLGALPAGSSQTVTIIATFAAPGTATDAAQVASITPDSNSANNSASFTTTINSSPSTPTADLSITESGTPSSVVVGQDETYTFVVTNHDPATTAQNVVVHDTLPTDATLIQSATEPPGGIVTSSFNTLTADLGNIAPGAAVVLTITVRYANAGSRENRATVTSDTSDSNQDNNSGSDTITVLATAG
jgi:uncharacterized repeat protein (TIGR01451 family)